MTSLKKIEVLKLGLGIRKSVGISYVNIALLVRSTSTSTAGEWEETERILKKIMEKKAAEMRQKMKKSGRTDLQAIELVRELQKKFGRKGFPFMFDRTQEYVVMLSKYSSRSGS